MSADGETGLRGRRGEIRVLLVDDDPDEVAESARLLEDREAPWTAVPETSVAAGLERLDEGDFDCVVSDVAPRRDAIKFLGRVRERYPDLPFILYTGRGSEELASEAISAGVTDYVRKEDGAEHVEVLANRIEAVVTGGRAGREIEPSGRRYRRLVQETADVVVIADVAGRFEYLSPSAERVLGYPPGELLGESGFEYVHPDDRDDVVELFDDLVARPSTRATAEFRFERDDGSWVWLEARGRNLLDDPAIDGLVVYTRDVTDRKERERELGESELRYRRLIESSPGPVFIYSERGELIYVNEAGVRLLGADGADALIGTESGAFTHPDDRSTVDDRYRRLVEEREPVPPVELKLQGVDGQTKYAIVASTPVTYEGEPAIQTVGMDITEAKERERELQRQKDRLDEFATVVSHDIRNPLNVASGRLELARDECDSPHLDDVADAHGRMESLIDDVLTLARQGRTVETVTEVDLATVAEDCWGTVETAGATIVTETERTIQADASRLQQLLENLVRNALEHGAPDVTITLGDLDDGFFVADDGPGIPPAERERVFDAGYSTTDDGTGFGLKIVEEIADAHGWSIDVTDADDGGARFEVTGVEDP